MTTGAQLEDALQPLIDAGELAGAATVVWRDGRASTVCVGWRDIEARLPVEPDTLFRIASLTKPVTSVAALTLVDDGRIALPDPIAKVAPEFAAMRVLRSPEGALDDTVAALRPITFEDLLTHRAGLTYADFHRGPISRAYRDQLGGDIDSPVAPADWIARLGSLPLIGQPGTAMTYGRATDLLGLLIARIEGESLGAVLKRRVLDPLGMSDTCFRVPFEKRPRRSVAYGFDQQGSLVPRSTWGGVVVEERPETMAYESGGAGLWSTLQDYLRFARLFVGRGAVDGVRILQPQTLAVMMTNHLTDEQRQVSELLGDRPFVNGRGFGLGVAVILEPDRADMMRRGGIGAVGWPGAYGGWWQADPTDDSVAIFLAHNMVAPSEMVRGVGLGTWAAVDTFSSLAAAM